MLIHSYPGRYNLSHHTGLRTLRLQYPLDIKSLDREAQLASPEFRTLSFVLCPLVVAGLTDKHYQTLDRLLAPPQFGRLKEIQFICEGFQ